MSYFAQDSTGDFLLTQGRLTVEKDPAKACAFKLFNRFRFFLGEWFLDTRLGVPYFQYVLVKNPDLNVVKQIFKKVILDTPPVVDVEELELNYDPRLRSMAPTFRARLNNGSTIIAPGTGEPFIVGGN